MRHRQAALQAADKHAAVFAAVQARLAERPVWLYPALQEALAADCTLESLAGLDTALSVLTFRFAAGPWQPALVRRGYNPRAEPQSWRYQVLTCTLPDSWHGTALQPELAAIAQRTLSPWQELDDGARQHAAMPVTTQYSHIASLAALPPSKVVHLQVCSQLCGSMLLRIHATSCCPSYGPKLGSLHARRYN